MDSTIEIILDPDKQNTRSTCDISLIIPAYNEAENIPAVVQAAANTLSACSQNYEILVVDDGSDDGTAAVTAKLARDIEHVHTVRHQINKGLGAALKTGYAACTGDLICYFPGDGQFPIQELHNLLPLLDQYDVVLTRPPQNAKSPLRKLLSKGQLFLTNRIVGEFQWRHGIPRLFKREVWQAVSLDSDTGFLNLEFAIKAAKQGFQMTEVEIAALPRLSGQSKVANFKTISRVYREMWRIRKST